MLGNGGEDAESVAFCGVVNRYPFRRESAQPTHMSCCKRARVPWNVLRAKIWLCIGRVCLLMKIMIKSKKNKQCNSLKMASMYC